MNDTTFMITGSNCPNCNMLKMMIKHMKLPEPEQIEADSQLGKRYLVAVNARSIPVLVRIKDDEIADSLVGVHHSYDKIRGMFDG